MQEAFGKVAMAAAAIVESNSNNAYSMSRKPRPSASLKKHSGNEYVIFATSIDICVTLLIHHHAHSKWSELPKQRQNHTRRKYQNSTASLNSLVNITIFLKSVLAKNKTRHILCPFSISFKYLGIELSNFYKLTHQTKYDV